MARADLASLCLTAVPTKKSAEAATAQPLIFGEVAPLQFQAWQAFGKVAATLAFLHQALSIFGGLTLVHFEVLRINGMIALLVQVKKWIHCDAS